MLTGVYLGFDAAQSACVDWGGNLASITSEQDAFHIKDMFATYFPEGGGAWIGLRSMHSEQLWAWTDGARFDYVNWEQVIDNSPGRGALCAYSTKYGTWRVDECATKMPHVLCAKGSSSVASQDVVSSRRSSSLSPWCDGTSQTDTTCWWVVNNPMTYEAAELACYQWGGAVAQAHSTDDVALLRSWGNAWLGLRRQCILVDEVPDCTWKWEITDSDANQDDWGLGEPSFDGSGKDCAYANSDGWVSVSCSQTVPKTVCSKDVYPCDTDAIWCESQLQVVGETNVRLLNSSCDCDCCFYFSGESNELKRIGECSSMCSTLTLNNQNITSLHQSVFEGLEHVRVLNLANNQIDALPDAIFQGLPGLSILNLKGNRIYDLDHAALTGLNSLVELNLADNEIAEITNETMSNVSSNLEDENWHTMKRLLLLDLTGNRIQHIATGSFQYLTSLVVLSLNRNFLSSCENINVPSALTTLNLERNHILVLSESSFAGVSSVRSLHLSHNDIQQIDRRSFYAVKDLRILGLAFNEIKSVEMGKLTHLNVLNTVMIRSNPLDCNPILPNSVVNLDYISGLPACLPIGCPPLGLSTTVLREDAVAEFESPGVAEAYLPLAMEEVMQMARSDVVQVLDNINLQRRLYVDYDFGERCWCTPITRCFSPSIGACAPGTLGNPCAPCPPQHFCPGDNSSYPCPANTTSAGGAGKCSCVPGIRRV